MADGAAVANRARFGAREVIGVAVAVMVTAAVLGVLWNERAPGQDRLCRGLSSGPDGLEVIAWDNGITLSGPSWYAALTVGVEHADGPSRRAIAAAVEADVSGYESMVADLPQADREQFDRLRRAVLDPDDPTSHPGDPRTSRALRSVRTLAVKECGLV